MSEKKLKMTFDPNTIEHLGVRMYSTLPPVLAELVANAYDADANRVSLILNDSTEDKEIIVEDDGEGMSFDEINDKFLRIGRNRRERDEIELTQKYGRKVIGKKGLGKLSFFGIAHEIRISTKKDGKENIFQMNWEDIKKEQKEYEPKVIERDKSCKSTKQGTTITLKRIQRKSDFSPEDLADSLSKMFIVDRNFKIEIRHNKDNPIPVTNERRHASLEKEIEWKIPDDLPDDYEDRDYYRTKEIKGCLIAAKKPVPLGTNMRGITLFSRKKMVNQPESFSDGSASSFFFNYLTGWLEVDFIDDLKDDVITTNRQSLNWEHGEIQELRKHLRGLVNWLERNWRKKRTKIVEDNTGINIPTWFEKLPDDTRKRTKIIVKSLENSELPSDKKTEAIVQLHEIVPEYPEYHWRHLHPQIREASREDYEKKDYYRAFQEAMKRYVGEVREKSGSKTTSEYDMMGKVFGKRDNNHKVLQVAKGFKKINGEDFSENTTNNIEEGQKFLSMGVVSGCRNPLAHEEIKDLRGSRLFTEKDCLDALSLLSHLFSRLDRAEKLETTTQNKSQQNVKL